MDHADGRIAVEEERGDEGRASASEPGEKILTRHPEGKKGVRISRQKYDVMRAAIMDSVPGKGQVPLQVVRNDVEADLEGRFEGSLSWYFTTVKLDLEARGVIERVPGKRPQHIRLV
jgi:hypothetical protein